eukprot:g58832.t1
MSKRVLWQLRYLGRGAIRKRGLVAGLPYVRRHRRNSGQGLTLQWFHSHVVLDFTWKPSRETSAGRDWENLGDWPGRLAAWGDCDILATVAENSSRHKFARVEGHQAPHHLNGLLSIGEEHQARIRNIYCFLFLQSWYEWGLEGARCRKTTTAMIRNLPMAPISSPSPSWTRASPVQP